MFENFINTKAKTYIVFLFSVAALAILAFSTQVAYIFCEKANGLTVGVTFMIAAIPLHILGKKYSISYIFSFLLNFIACGFSVSAFYLTKDLSLNLSQLFIATIPSGAILVLIYLMLQTYSKTKKVTLSIGTTVNFALLVVAVVYWIRTGETFFSFGFFSLLVSLFFICIFGITINHDERSVLKDISYGSFGSFVILTIVVIVILSEGDILELGDLGIDGGSRKKKGKIR
ncbi:MAG: hypothetical protein ACYC5K_07005 [Saccharofermentanales bacterium]